MRACSVLAVIVGWVVFPLAGAEGEREWPCFHGPRRDNRSRETGLLKSWPAGGPGLLWTASGLGSGYSSVTIADGRIYTAGMIRNQTYVFALDPGGEVKWRQPNGRSWQSTMSHAVAYAGARGTPTYDAGRIYHLGERGRLAAFDARSGKEIWSSELLKRFDAEVPKYGLAGSVLIDGDRLIVCPGGAKGHMVCLGKAAGKLVWACTEIAGTVAYSSPVIAELGGVRQVLGMSSKTAFGVDAGTGKLLWSVAHGNYRENSATDPIFHKGHVFASCGYGQGSVVVRLERAS
ncbi:MAG: PQQ-binding-like beta-propeller repeat protein, partial [Phycisphaerae bacterium]